MPYLKKPRSGCVKRVTALVTMLIVLSALPACAFRDDFNVLDTSVWDVHPNAGSVRITNGRLVLSAPPNSTTAPYLFSRANPFPVSGDFVMRVGLRFTALGHETGVAAAGQDFAFGMTSSCADLGTSFHEIEWMCSGGRVSCKVDGKPDGCNSCVRPQLIVIGSPARVPGGCRWTSFEIDYIEVLPTSTSSSEVAADQPVSASPSQYAPVEASQGALAPSASGESPQPAQPNPGPPGTDPFNVLLLFAAIVVVFATQFVKEKKTQTQLVFALVGIALLAIMVNVSWNPLVALVFLLGIGVIGTIYILVLRAVVRGVAHVATAPFRAAIDEHVHLAEQKSEIGERQANVAEMVEHGFPSQEQAPIGTSLIICQECGRANPASATECTKCHQSIAKSQSVPPDRGGDKNDSLS